MREAAGCNPYGLFHKRWDGTRNARLNLLEAFSQAITAVNSTI